MPNLNRKGPNGEGSMTGRKMGKCNPENKGKTDEEILYDKRMPSLSETSMGFGQGRGLGFGRGQGRGQGRGLGFGRGQGQGLGKGFRRNG